MAAGITQIQGIEVGHYTDLAGATGCTVVLCRQGGIAGVDVRGGAPGTRDTDLLSPGRMVQEIHGVLLSGGSAFGLDAAGGVMRYLEERKIGFQLGAGFVPIVPSAIIYDLNLVSGAARPSLEDAYAACEASSTSAVEEGSVGAGTGATVAKGRGMKGAVKGGIGTAYLQLRSGIGVGAIIVVNAYGGMVDPSTGSIIAGPRREDGSGFWDPVDLLLRGPDDGGSPAGTNTTIGVVGTDAQLTKDQAHYLARVSHDGLALAIRPCHTMRDGDTIFSLATGKSPATADMTQLGAAATEVVAQAVLRAAQKATGLGGVPALSEL